MGQDTRFWIEDEQRAELRRLKAIEAAARKFVETPPGLRKQLAENELERLVRGSPSGSDE